MPATAPKPTRHQEAAAASRAETRRRLLHAAEAEFTERGYAAATVAKIAARAGVTVQTLYLAWGSKRALLRAYMEAALAGDDETSYPQARPDMIADVLDGALDDPAAIVRQIGVLYRQIAERAALGWQLYRDGAASDPEIAADWQALQALRHQTFSALIKRLPAGSLRPGLTRELGDGHRLGHRQPRHLRHARPDPRLHPRPIPEVGHHQPHHAAAAPDG